MKKILSISLIVIVSIICTACKKDKPRQYSYWKINGQEFSTNDTKYSIAKNGSDLTSYGSNSFSFYNLGYGVPSTAFTVGQHLLSPDTISNDPELLHAYFKYNDIIYSPMPDHNDTIVVSMPNQKIRYTLYPSWFVNKNNANDSVLIEGTFNEP